MGRVHTACVGCKVSLADGRAAAEALVAAGHEVAAEPEAADVSIVVTCGVTAEAERKSRRLVRRLARGGRPVVVAGCAAALRGGQFAGPGVTVAPAGDAQAGLDAAVSLALETLAEGRGGVAGPGTAAPTRGRTRFTLKVQDGCPAACTYCAVRLARGRCWSLAPAAAADAVVEAVAGGCGEVVLSGVNLGRYAGVEAGDAGDTAVRVDDLADLVTNLADTPGLRRLRLSSLEPLDLTPRLLDALGGPRVARHLHVPLQSADDTVLRAMGRPYSFEQYREIVGRARAALGDDLALTTDVIVGFPAEDEAAFARTLAALVPPDGLFSRVHVFRYSPRPETAAAALGRLAAEVVDERMDRALAAAGAAREAAAAASLGRRAEVLVEERAGARGVAAGAGHGHGPGGALWKGYSSQYVRYYLSGEAGPGELVTAVADELHADGVKGRIV